MAKSNLKLLKFNSLVELSQYEPSILHFTPFFFYGILVLDLECVFMTHYLKTIAS